MQEQRLPLLQMVLVNLVVHMEEGIQTHVSYLVLK